MLNRLARPRPWLKARKRHASDRHRKLAVECLQRRLLLAASDPLALGSVLPAGDGDNSVSIGDVSVVEDEAKTVNAVFPVTLSQPADQAVTVNKATADGAAIGLNTVRVASGLSRPILATSPPGDADRLFIAEQHTGRIKILNLNTGVVNPTPFLDIDGLSTSNEQGLLGMAFHPDYATNGLFYVNFTDSGWTTNIRRYQVSAGDPDVADPPSAQTVLTYSQPGTNHNGGWLGFGPDDYLYISSGDGGLWDNGQDITDKLLGKMLRLDVDGDDFPADPNRNYAIPASNPLVGVTGDDEIWAYGLRNPWRASFDRATGDLYIADVGQNSREEIDVQPAASSGGENYGWRPREGTIGTRPPGAIDPVYDYSHGSGPTQGYSVTGGYVYRGPIDELQGLYFFADYVTDRIWSFRFDGSDPNQFDGTNFVEFTDWTDLLVPDAGRINNISSFGEDALANLYIVDLGGEVFRIDADPLPPATVVGRQVFYNNSAFDGDDPAANVLDDDAIAPDKTALLPGQTAAFANYTSYSRGINGIMVDVANLAGTPTDADFEFKVGNRDGPAGWSTVAAEAEITLRPGAGVGGSDRVTIIWPDHAIQKQWLQVKVRAGGNVGTLADDVFYFGNAVGESGNSTSDAKVNAFDMLAARDNQRTFIDPAPIDFPFDFDRDTRVSATDMLIARNNSTHFLNALALIDVPAGKAAGEEAADVADPTGRGSARPDAGGSQSAPAPGKLDWLFEFEQTFASQRPSDKGRGTEAAVDWLLREGRG